MKRMEILRNKTRVQWLSDITDVYRKLIIESPGIDSSHGLKAESDDLGGWMMWWGYHRGTLGRPRCEPIISSVWHQPVELFRLPEMVKKKGGLYYNYTITYVCGGALGKRARRFSWKP
jgi:hypothetical protein